jgi:shikimate kinase
MSKLLLSGVPATGKSTLAKYLESERGYHHIDMEGNNFSAGYEFRKDRQKFLERFAAYDNVVINWGFMPFADRKDIELIRENGFTIVWLDGNRVASFREYMKREKNNPLSEGFYYRQMELIVITGIIETLKPLIVNPYNELGEFRLTNDIAEEVIGLVSR